MRAELCKAGHFPTYCDLQPKPLLLGIPLMILSATVYYSSCIRGLATVKRLLIAVADHRL